MTLTKRILSGLLAAGMILSLTACDEDPAVSGGNSAGNTPGAPAVTTTAATTTTDPDDNAPTDAEIKEVGTDAYTPDGNSGTIVWLGYYDLITDGCSSVKSNSPKSSTTLLPIPVTSSSHLVNLSP